MVRTDCVDYPALNSVTYKDIYPLPHIDTCLGSMGGAIWFSTLGLMSGYHNVPIRESDGDKTVFITQRWCLLSLQSVTLWVHHRIFSLSATNGFSTMCVDVCHLSSVLDDIIVYAKNCETHLSRVREVFTRLQAVNLKLHAGKCCVFQRRVAFLGHVLSANGIEVQDDKIVSIRDWQTPRDLAELRSFLGLCSYYRRFIERFADVTAPLHKLQRRHVAFEWTKEQNDAFNCLKRMLISAPVLLLEMMILVKMCIIKDILFCDVAVE